MSFTYDTRGRNLTETDPDTGFKWWSYDALGEVLISSQSPTAQATTPSNTTTYIKDTYAYDDLGRVTQRTDGDGLTT